MVSDEISASPPLSSSRTIADTIFSTRSGSTWRLRKEICSERTSLSRSNGTRRPLRLITVSSRSCTRSKVVKRKLQAMQTRRRRITAESSVGRESFTCVSRLLQLGQRMDQPTPSLPDPPSPSLPGLTRQSIRFERLLRRGMDARVKPAHDAENVETLRNFMRLSHPSINRKTIGERFHALLHRSFHQR